MTRPFCTTEEEKTLFRSAQPLDFSLEGAYGNTAWLADRAFGVVTTRLWTSCESAADFEEVVKLRAARKLQQVPWESCGTCLGYRFLGDPML